MTVPEVANYFRVTKMTVHRWIRAGKLSALQIGRDFRVREDSVQALLDASKVAPVE